MPSKRKKTISSGPRRNYTTRQIMEITEQRRLKEETAWMENEDKTKVKTDKPLTIVEDLRLPPLLPVAETPQIIKEVKTFVSQANIRPPQEIVEETKEVKSADSIPALQNHIVFNIPLTAFFILSLLNFSKPWVNAVAAKLNAMVVWASFLVFSIGKLSCSLEGPVLNLPYYKISLQGDRVAFYSVEFLILLATLFAFVQNKTWEKESMVFISLVPLAIVANMLRLFWACGLAFNYGAASADRYFHGILIGFVFIFIVLGLICIEFLSSPE